MIKGAFTFVFGIISAVVVTALIILVTFAIGRAVTGSWNPAEWKTSDDATVATEYQYVCDNTSSENCILII